MSFRLLLVPAIILLTTACGKSSGRDQPGAQRGVTELKYITFGDDVTGLVAQVKKPTMTACLTGVSTAEKAEWDEKITTSILRWVDTMRDLTSDELTSAVDVQLDGRGCEVDVTVREGVWANTEIGQDPTVNMGASGYMASFNTMLHEFGHAFALSDTYQNTQSGNCMPGQPQAVMCNTTFDTPQSDDIKGLAEIFHNEFPSDKPGGPKPKYELFAALGEGSAGSFALRLGLTGDAEKSGGRFAVCQGGANQCKSASATWTEAARKEAKADAVIFGLEGQTVTEGLQLTLRYQYEGGAAYRTVEFKSEV